MDAKKLSNGTITHIGLIVRDIEATRRHYVEMLGTPEAGIGQLDEPSIAKTQFHGKPSPTTQAKLCHLKVGAIQIELIQPTGGPSTWQDFLDKHGEGVHHIAIETKDGKGDLALLQGNDCPLIQRGEWVGGNYSYADTGKKLGVMLELIEND